MQLAKTLNQIFVNLARALDNHKIDFTIAGAFAVSIYTQPRATSDIDLVACIDEERRERIVSILAKEFKLIQSHNETMPMRFYEIWRHVIKIQANSPMLVPIDFISVPNDYLAAVLSHSLILKIDNVAVRFLSKEDLIITKLNSTRVKDIDDIDRLLKEKGKIDLEYIRIWANKFSLDTDILTLKR